MTILVVIAVISILLALYVVWFRPWMRNTAWGKAMLDKIEPMERLLWWKSETILWSRFKVLLGSVLTALVVIDWNTVAPLIPEKYRPFLLALPTIFTAVDGLIGESLRKDTTKPLEIVAMRTDAPPEVKAAAAEAAQANKEAVAATVKSEAA